MFNTVEKRRRILVLVVGAILFHLFASGALIDANTVENVELQSALQEFYAEYALMWGN